MNFIWFVVALVIFEILFWYYIFMILGLPGMGAMALLVYATENAWRKWVKWLLLPPARALAFIFGMVLIAFVYGGALALIAQHFAENASYPWIYWVICGIAAAGIMAPSGETNLLAMLLSLASYILVVFSNILTGVLGAILGVVLTILQFVVWIALVGLLCYGLFLACNWVLEKTFLRGKPQETGTLQRNISLFKSYVLIYLLWVFLPLWLLLPIHILLGELLSGTVGDVVLVGFAFVAFLLYVILLSRVYTVSNKLNEEGFLRTSGFSMLVIAILLTLAFQIGVVVLFIVLWVKSNRYLKTLTIPMAQRQTNDFDVIEGETYENSDIEETFGTEIVPSTNDIQKEISTWETRISEKENEASDLSIQIQDIEIAMNLFLGEYYSRVGIFYVKLDKLKLRIKEYEHRIDVAQGRKLTPEDLESIETEVDKTFSQERRKVDDLENEASESAQEYDRHLEEEKRKPFDPEFQQELKRIYRRLALKFHPDKAKDDKQARQFQKIFAAIAEAYKKGDLETLKKYMKQAEREEKIAKETPEEKLARLKKDYENLLGIVATLCAELEDLKANETYKLKEKVDQAKKEGRELLHELAADIKEEIAENQAILDKLVVEYKDIIGDMAY
jgi:hypothetical protein